VREGGCVVWRAVPARALGGAAFRLEGPVPPEAGAAFGPGDELLCERRVLPGGEPGWVVLRRVEGGWSVWREDDHGGRFEVRRAMGHAAATALALQLEAGGHKQRYWIAPTLRDSC
jgi:hypothetical protein